MKRKLTKERLGKAGLFIISIVVLNGPGDYAALYGSDMRTNHQPKSVNQQSPIRLVLSTPKKAYRVGEAVEITVLLENISDDRTFLVGRTIYQPGLRTPFHYVDILLSNRKGALSTFDGIPDEDPILKFGSDRKLVLPARPSITELTGLEYVQLGPGAVYGFRARLFKPGATPGRYRLSARYHEVEALQRTTAELRVLPIPIWTEPLVSNTLEVNVNR